MPGAQWGTRRSVAGKSIRFVKITRDITEKREAAEALGRANAALLRSQKLEAIGQLTDGIAHDFNNLLAVLATSLEVMARRPRDATDIRLVRSTRTTRMR